MAEENVEVVRRIYAGWERGDLSAAVEWFHPEVVFETFMPDAREYVTARGFAEIEAFMRSWFSQWRDYRVIGDEFQELGNDKVFVSGRQAATGKHSGAKVESPHFTVWTFRAGRVTKLLAHYDRDRAIEAAGLVD
jgi:ketosteroid isomerase-like protein